MAEEISSEEKEREEINKVPLKKLTLKIGVTAIFIAVGVVLSAFNPFGYFELFGTKIDPFAHIMNALSGVLIGLLFSVITATGIAIIRFSIGIGTIHAFWGGISGAVVVSIVAYFIAKKKSKFVEYAAFTEPIGTVFIGGTIAEIIVPLYGSFSFGGLIIYWSLFFGPSVVGCIIGFLILKLLKKAGYTRETFMN